MATYPLNEYVEAAADGNGKAIASTGPRTYGENWKITTITCSSNSTTESQLRIYRGVESDSALVASTYSGNQDTAGGNPIELPSGDKLVFVWTNASPGAICTARLEGNLISRRL